MPNALYRHPLLLTAGLIGTAVAALSLRLSGEAAWRGGLALALVAAFGLTFALFRTGHVVRRAYAYLAWQTALSAAALLLYAEPSELTILLNILAVHAALLLPPRVVAAWLAGFIVLGGLNLGVRSGWTGAAALSWLGYSTGLAAFAIVGGALRRADEARRQSQVLLAELREAHAQLRAYAEQSRQLAVLEERNRLARDLHDSVKQQAFALAAQLGAARSLLPQPAAAPQVQARLAEAALISDNLRQELEGLIQALRPPALAGQGLGAVLADYAAQWSRQAGVAAEAHTPDPGPLPAPVEAALYRIAQEALANVARHSQARRVWVRLERAAGQVVLSVRDDGQGFEPTAGAGLGLASMRERAAALGGALAVTSVPGQGTSVEARLPCP